MKRIDTQLRARKRPTAQRARAADRTRTSSTPQSRERSVLERQVLQEIRTVVGSARVHDAEVRRLAGLSGSQLWALSEIAQSAGLSVNALAERMALHQTTASNLVNALVERKLIRRERDSADQRVARLHITTDGKKMLLRAPGPYAGPLVDALRHLDDKQLLNLRKCLATLLGAMRRTASSAAGEILLGE